MTDRGIREQCGSFLLAQKVQSYIACLYISVVFSMYVWFFFFLLQVGTMHMRCTQAIRTRLHACMDCVESLRLVIITLNHESFPNSFSVLEPRDLRTRLKKKRISEHKHNCAYMVVFSPWIRLIRINLRSLYTCTMLIWSFSAAGHD